MSLLALKKEFDKRHEFDTEDVKYLYKRYPKIKFSNIPLAWVINIDDLLCDLPHSIISEIRQDFGQPIFIFKDDLSKYKSKIDECERRLLSIDKDLHKLYGYL